MATLVPERHLLTLRETATLLRVSEKTVRRMIDRDGLPALRVGTSIRVDSGELDEWLYADRGDDHGPAKRVPAKVESVVVRGQPPPGRGA